MSFSLNFPDTKVFDVLGDDIDVNGTIIKAEFKELYDKESLVDRIDMINPTLEIKNENLPLFTTNSVVTFNGESYSVLRFMPEDSNTTLVMLRQLIL
jgi:hypothetical protein